MSYTPWGQWSLSEDEQVLMHSGGYGIALADIDDERDLPWWMTHLGGKFWGTPDVLADFEKAVTAMGRRAA